MVPRCDATSNGFIRKQLETVVSIGPDAVKTGMLGTEEIIKRAGEAFEQSGAKYFVVDPVMVCKGEDEVLNPGNTDAMIKYLLPKATVVTPNLFEAGQLSGLGKLTSIEDMKKLQKSFMIKVLNILLLKVVKH